MYAIFIHITINENLHGFQFFPNKTQLVQQASLCMPLCVLALLFIKRSSIFLLIDQNKRFLLLLVWGDDGAS
jgi:hypothetical protein